MLHFNQSRIKHSTAYPIATGEEVTAEGKALVAVYENNLLTVKESAGDVGEKFVGVSFSNILPIPTLPVIKTITAVGTTVTLAYDPIPSSVQVVGLTVGDPATNADEYSISGRVITVHASLTNTNVVVQYQRSPTVQEAQSIQGDLEPGLGTSSVIGEINAITSGEVFTTEFDTAETWDSGSTTLKLSAGGLFSSTGIGTEIDALVTQIPSESSPVLGFRYNI